MAATIKDAKLYNDLVKSLRDWIKLNVAKKKTTNLFNQGNTVSKNYFKLLMQNEAFPARTKIIIDGHEFAWAVATSDVIDVRKWHQMLVKKEITEDQYFDALRVTKEDAVNSIGEDQVATISSLRDGRVADIRYNDKNVTGAKKGVEIVLPEGIKPKVGGIKPRLGIPVQVPAPRPTLIRRINIRRPTDARK